MPHNSISATGHSPTPLLFALFSPNQSRKEPRKNEERKEKEDAKLTLNTDTGHPRFLLLFFLFSPYQSRKETKKTKEQNRKKMQKAPTNATATLPLPSLSSSPYQSRSRGVFLSQCTGERSRLARYCCWCLLDFRYSEPRDIIERFSETKTSLI